MAIHKFWLVILTGFLSLLGIFFATPDSYRDKGLKKIFLPRIRKISRIKSAASAKSARENNNHRLKGFNFFCK